MSQVRHVFTVGSEDATLRSAGYLAQAFYPNEATKVRDLADEQSLAGIDKSDLNKIVVLAHGSTTTYGEYQAVELAKLFSKRFRENFPDSAMDQVRDLYLIGCEIGLINSDDGGSMAQEIANALDKSGFHKVVVHCIARPENAKGDVLYVEVLNCSGTAGLLALTSALAHNGSVPDVQTGFLKAYILSQEDADQIARLEQEKHKNYAEIARIKREDSFLLANHVHPETELNKPHNTFYPRETVDNRKLRVMRDSTRQLSAMHAEATALLVHRSEYLKKKSVVKEAVMSKKLDFLVTQMRMADDEHWHLMVNEYARYLKNHLVFGTFFNEDSKSAQLLTALGKKDIKAANKIVDAQDGKKTERRSVMQMLNLRKAEAPKKANIVAAPPPSPEMPFHLVMSIRQLSVSLDNEITALRTSVLGCFASAKIKTKLAKLAVIKSLQDCTNLVEAKQIARANLNNPVIVAGMMKSRTSDLLREIDEFQPAAVSSLELSVRF